MAKSLLKKEVEEAISKYGIVEVEAIADKEHEFPIGWYERIGLRQTGLTHIAGSPQEILASLNR